jgi:hypothetical protein
VSERAAGAPGHPGGKPASPAGGVPHGAKGVVLPAVGQPQQGVEGQLVGVEIAGPGGGDGLPGALFGRPGPAGMFVSKAAMWWFF